MIENNKNKEAFLLSTAVTLTITVQRGTFACIEWNNVLALYRLFTITTYNWLVIFDFILPRISTLTTKNSAFNKMLIYQIT